MEVRQLEYLLAVADTGTFTAAAARVHVAQPAISAQIAALEREVGQRLFDRTPRGAVPTDAGQELSRYARDILDRLAAAREAMDELSGLVRGRVTVGLVRGVPLGRLASDLGELHRAHPGIDISLREAESADLLDGLADGTIDVALVGLSGRTPDGITATTVLQTPVGVVVAADDRWAGRRRVRFPELVERTLITLAPGTGVRTAVDTAWREHGRQLRIAFEVGTIGAAVELARAGLGVALVPADPTITLGGGARALGLVGPVIRSRLDLAWAADARSTGRPAVRALIAALRTAGPGVAPGCPPSGDAVE